MNQFQSLGVAGSAWRGAVALAARPVIWLPLLLVTCVQFGIMLLFVSFHYPALLPLGLPLIRLLGGEGATHYPILYYALPTMFFRANLGINVLIASIAGGVATLLFAKAFGFGREGNSWGRALRRAPALMITTLLVVGVLFGIAALATLVPKELVLRNFAARWGIRGATMLLLILVQSFVAYTTAWIVLMGHGIWPAIRDSVRVTVRTFLPTVIVVGLPAVLLYPFSYASGRVDLIATKLRPEILSGLLSTQIVCQLLLTFLLVGAITRLFLWRVEAAR